MVRSKTKYARELFLAWKPRFEDATRFYAQGDSTTRWQQGSTVAEGSPEDRFATVLGALGELCSWAPTIEPKLCHESLGLFLRQECTRGSYDEWIFAGMLDGFAAVATPEELRRPFIAQCGFTNKKPNPPLTLIDILTADQESWRMKESVLRILIDRLPDDASVISTVKANLKATDSNLVAVTLSLMSASKQKAKWRKTLLAELAQLVHDRSDQVSTEAKKLSN
jgi:hypothetical protein